jgi:hypothetical protein
MYGPGPFFVTSYTFFSLHYLCTKEEAAGFYEMLSQNTVEIPLKGGLQTPCIYQGIWPDNILSACKKYNKFRSHASKFES